MFGVGIIVEAGGAPLRTAVQQVCLGEAINEDMWRNHGEIQMIQFKTISGITYD